MRRPSELLRMGRKWGVAAWFGSVLAASPAHASPNPVGFWVSLSAEYRRGTVARQWSGFLILNVPFDRFAAPPAPPPRGALSEDAPNPAGQREPLSPAAAPEVAPTAPVVVMLTPRLARGTVRHALATAGYVRARSRLSNLGARARHSAALPEVRLRTQHSAGQTLRLTPTTDDPYRYTQAGTSELALEARLTWHLDRLVFAGEEVAIERLEHERDAAERRLIEYVLARLLSWQRGRTRAADPDLDPDARATAELEAIGAAVELDVLTDGWFSQAIGETTDDRAADAGESPKVEVKTARHAR